MPSPSSMSGKAVLVTGAAAGLGKAVSLALARTGANVCMVDINAEALAQTAKEIEALNVLFLVQAVDLSDTRNCAPTVAAAVDALCNGAVVNVTSCAAWSKLMMSLKWSPILHRMPPAAITVPVSTSITASPPGRFNFWE